MSILITREYTRIQGVRCPKEYWYVIIWLFFFCQVRYYMVDFTLNSWAWTGNVNLRALGCMTLKLKLLTITYSFHIDEASNVRIELYVHSPPQTYTVMLHTIIILTMCNHVVQYACIIFHLFRIFSNSICATIFKYENSICSVSPWLPLFDQNANIGK